MSVKKVSDRVARVMSDYSYRITNRIPVPEFLQKEIDARSEERRVGKECRL